MDEILSMFAESVRSDAVILPLLVAIPLALAGMLLWGLMNRHEGSSLAAAIGTSRWRLVHSAREGDHFFDADSFLGSPANLDKLARWFRGRIRLLQKEMGRIDYLAFIEKGEGPVGVLTSKDLLSARTRIPSFVVRPHRRVLETAMKGNRNSSVYVVHDGSSVVLVTDVVTTGDTLLEAIELLEHCGARVKETVALYDREDENFRSDEFARRGIRLTAMIRRSEVERVRKDLKQKMGGVLQ